jgi:hypothetical protein
MCDAQALAAIAKSRNMLIPWYLMASYLYYHKDESLLSDPVFDQIAKRIMEEWDQITHWHRDVVNRDDLSAGTCLLTAGEFPLRTRYAAELALKGP